MLDIHDAAKLLGRQLCGHVPHVVGVSILRRDPNVPELNLFVDVDSDETIRRVPHVFEGHKVHIRRVGTPIFANR